MADEREIIVEACSLITVACSIRGCEFIIEKEKKTLRVDEKVHPWQLENVTLCYWNLLLLKW